MKKINWNTARSICKRKKKEAEIIYEHIHDFKKEFAGISRTKFADAGKKVKPGDRFLIEPEGEIEFNESIENPGTYQATLNKMAFCEGHYVQIRDKNVKILLQGKIIMGRLSGRLSSLDDIDPSFFTVLPTEK